MLGWLVNNELEGVCKEAVVASFQVLAEYLPRMTEENHNIAGIREGIWTLDLPNTKPECWPLDYVFLFFFMAV
jgi:hypothetical protein